MSEHIPRLRSQRLRPHKTPTEFARKQRAIISFLAIPDSKYDSISRNISCLRVVQRRLANDPSIKKQRQAQADAGLAQDKALCGKLGFKAETDGMANCLLTQYQNRLGLAVKDKEMEIEGAKAEAKALSDLAKGIQNSAPKATSCSTFGSTTSCYTY